MEVWTLQFKNPNYTDLNGIYSSREKARDALFSHAMRMNKEWGVISLVGYFSNFEGYFMKPASEQETVKIYIQKCDVQ